MTTTPPQITPAARAAARGEHRCREHPRQPVRPDGRGCPQCTRARAARRSRRGNPASRWWEQ